MEQVSYIHIDSRSRDTVLYPFSNSYTVFLNKPITNVTRVDLVSAIVTNPFSTGNAYIWLDITELRTPSTYSGSKLTLTNVGATSNVTVQRNQPSSQTPATSFAAVPITVSQNFQQTFREMTDYEWSVAYPSRLDSIERLTIRWLDYQGSVVNFGNAQTYDPNMFILRVHTQVVPTAPERPISLPPPVNEGFFNLEDKSKVYVGALGTLIVGLIMIMLLRKRR